MRVLVTADIHFNHPRSRTLAVDLIEQINRESFDVLILAGDTATSEAGHLEDCLSRFTFRGPRLFIAGNHELWTRDGDSYELFTSTLPDRVRRLGWHWLEGDPVVLGDVGFVGSIGWYDYSFAAGHLGIPRRFYEAKSSPGAAERLGAEHGHLLRGADDVTDAHREIIARWNDGRYVRLNRSDEAFLKECLDGLRDSLARTRHAQRVVAALHHLPFSAMLPPRRNATWDFVWAYLGAQGLGELLLEHKNISHVFCGHSHMPMEHHVEHLKVVNIGSGYRQKRMVTIELPD